MEGFVNRWTDALVIRGVSYAPGDVIPATADPAQLAAFARQGIVEPTTAPAPAPSKLRRVTPSQDAVKEEVPDGGSHDSTL
jgi:hypothetical protein